MCNFFKRNVNLVNQQAFNKGISAGEQNPLSPNHHKQKSFLPDLARILLLIFPEQLSQTF